MKPTPNNLKQIPIFFALCCSLLLPQAHADSHPNSSGNHVSFSVTASQSIENDRVTLTFAAFAQNNDPEAVAQKINKDMRSATEQLKKHPEITIQTDQYQIRPIYNKDQQLTHWRGQQTLTLHLKNQPNLAKIMSKIQPFLRYQNMQFSVSNERRQMMMDAMTQQAILRFQRKAKMIAESFQQPTYKIIETRIQTPNLSAPYLSRAYVSAEMASDSPVLQAGETQLSVTIEGVLVLPEQ